MRTITKLLHRRIFLLACLVMVLSTAACGVGQEEGGKLVVVKEPTENTGSGAGAEPDTINKYEGVSGLDWLDNDHILAQTAGGDGEGNNKQKDVPELWALDLRTESRTPWNAGTGVVWLSPDRRQAFVAESTRDKYTLTGKLVDLYKGTFREVALEEGIIVGGWSDQGELVLVMGQGNIVMIDSSGVKIPVRYGHGSDEAILSLQKSGDTMFMLNADGKLKALSVNNPELHREKGPLPRTLLSGVTEFRVAPGAKQIAVVTGFGEAECRLRLYDPNGKAIDGEIAKSSLVDRLAWSADGSKLAFSAYSSGQGMRGIYVFDTISGRISLVSDLQGVSYPLRWSPSGNRLMLTVSGNGTGYGGSALATTFILAFHRSQ